MRSTLAEILPVIIRTFPWPKSMRWGARSGKPGSLNWVRPLHAITATFGLETEEPDVVKFSVDGIEAGQTTYGHRFLAPAAISVRRFEDYEAKLLDAKVVLDPERRKDAILTDAKQLAFAQGFELVEDQNLLDEVAGLVEWPVVLMGSFEPEFLATPAEVIRATIRNNQKCFVVRDPKTGKLANKFILVANIEATDGGATIIAGNERVIRARLSDAKFFYETDLKTKLEDRLPKFDQIVFHEKLGTQAERIKRIERLAAEIAPLVGADVAKVTRAAHLAKADLLTEVVGEFPEVQGLMGKYYALAQGEDASVAAACEEHYKPQGPADRVPTDPVSVAVALADKIDTLVGFWAIDEKPTGSKDPYALRRAALGVIRLIAENALRLSLMKVAASALAGLSVKPTDAQKLPSDLLAFFADRLKVQLREQGARHDLVDAVFALGGQDDLLMIVRRVEALGKFLDSDDGRTCWPAPSAPATSSRSRRRRTSAASTVRRMPRSTASTRRRRWRKRSARSRRKPALRWPKDFAAAMSAMAKLRPPVDAFFDKVRVNDDDAKVRENRLKLLNEIRSATRAVADFSKIQD